MLFLLLFGSFFFFLSSYHVFICLFFIALYLIVVKFAFWLILLVIVAVFIGLYFVEHTNQIWRENDARKAVTAVIDGLTRKGFITRDFFKLSGLSMPSERLRTFNRAIYELELAKTEAIHLEVMYIM